jgi:hypothetical protein
MVFPTGKILICKVNLMNNVRDIDYPVYDPEQSAKSNLNSYPIIASNFDKDAIVVIFS